MPTRPHRVLPAFALVALVAALASAAPATSGKALAGAETVSAGQPEPRPRPARAKKPTVGERAAAFALEAVGTPYRWGGESPGSGFDCSGLVRWAYLRLGIALPHSSYALYETGRRVARTRLRPGDVLVFSGLGHVGLYVGRNRMVHAPYSGRWVEVVRLRGTHYGSRLVAARRVVRA